MEDVPQFYRNTRRFSRRDSILVSLESVPHGMIVLRLSLKPLIKHRSPHVAQTGLEFRSSCLSLPSAGVTSVYLHPFTAIPGRAAVLYLPRGLTALKQSLGDMAKVTQTVGWA
jgi:hypothetical protein